MNASIIAGDPIAEYERLEREAGEAVQRYQQRQAQLQLAAEMELRPFVKARRDAEYEARAQWHAVRTWLSKLTPEQKAPLTHTMREAGVPCCRWGAATAKGWECPLHGKHTDADRPIYVSNLSAKDLRT